ncbi:DNA polymerase III subunit gamma/tau [Fusibacter ferrireducens]|uniref:DNA-directed DNA polymerase n=1 Tax=Fusibacter ferrireducens TaxID=2785058 RepID=A0ABR9ZYB2_9FIRM|nr:DNA polymerase III subunit gamma/tau [Fusibacter ferrireducens]MBF4695455.1 DNA polymerase III subunit gamma/tau [Fusibacter ferrireducens]
MAYQALYRKWRPLNFDEIIGQNHIILPIKNQIVNNSIGHAYLFSGTRGTGKTTTAKVLARAVNCLNNLDGNPCNTCENCKSILEDQFIDVVEMDAASNNSVDDIRELREHVKFAPSKGRFKVYIIDEVHMLSQGAFNALLKTLEEPPEYVLFILATTESHKIPATILSRCQRFDFKRVSYDDLLFRLKYICDQTEVTYDIEALKLIIEKSDGAVRDSISSLDQCLSVGTNRLLVEDVVDLLGLVENKIILQLIEHLIQKDANQLFIQVDEIIKSGKDLNQFINAIIEVYRDLLIVLSVKENYDLLINASKEYMETLKGLSIHFSQIEISRALNLFIELSKHIKYSQNKRILFEATLVKIMNVKADQTIEGLIERIDKLERIIYEGGSIPNTPLIKKTRASVAPQPITDKGLSPKTTLPEGASTGNALKAASANSKEDIEPFIEFTDSEIGLDDVFKIWDGFTDTIKAEKKGIMPVFENATPLTLSGNRVTIGIASEDKLFINIVQNAANLKYLESLMSRLLKKLVSLHFEIKEEEHKKALNPEDQVRDYFKDYKDVLEIK